MKSSEKTAKKNVLNLGIKGKLLFIFITLAVSITLIMSVISYISGSSSISKEVIAKLAAVSELKTSRLENFMESRYGEINIMTGLDIMKNAADALINEIQASDVDVRLSIDDKKNYFKRVSQNYRHLSQYVSKYFDALTSFAEIKFVAAYDIMNRKGQVIFAEGEQVISTGGYKGNTKDRSMFKAGIEVMTNKRKGIQAQNYNYPLLYSSSIEHCGELNKSSIHLSNGLGKSGFSVEELKKSVSIRDRFSFMMIFDLKIESIDSLLKDSTGMGDTGESYMAEKVGDKIIMLSESRFEKGTVLKKELTGIKSIEDHIKRNEHKRGAGICENIMYTNYRGVEVLSHNHMLKLGDHDAALITEIGKAEIFSPVTNLLLLMTILGVIVIAVSVILGIFFSSGISKPIKFSAAFAETIAKGDLTKSMEPEFLDRNDELGDLAKSLDRMSSDLQELISSIIIASQNLGQAVDQIALGNQNLSQRVSEQASSLEEIASTAEEANASTKQNSNNALEANKFADDSYNLAQEGGNISIEAVSQINEISHVGKKIGEITNVINEISFQTNLLALNAAVEAARAGDAGRGFSVVAGEIRNLAQRSGSAAKEIDELIKSTISKIDTGTKLVNRSGESLINIIGAIKKVSDIIKEITAASTEQQQGIEQINLAINELDMMTQQNAALVEETASASEEMANQAQELISMTKRFKVNEKTAVKQVSSETVHKNEKNRQRLAISEKKSGKTKIAGNAAVEKKHPDGAASTKNSEDKNDLKISMIEDGFEEF